MTEIVTSKKQFEEAYAYKSSKPTKYPKKYPALLYKYYEEGGLGGSYIVHEIIEIPKGLDIHSFKKGVEAGIKLND